MADFDKKAPIPGLVKEPIEPATAEEPLRRQLAKTMCRRYEIVLDDGGPLICEKGIPCGSRPACMDMADKVLSYAEERKEARIAKMKVG